MSELTDKYICKIEGHGYLKISYEDAKALLVIDEGERLFEKLILGRHYLDAPFVTARICGVCPTAHTLAAIAALENAFKVEVNKEIEELRKVLLAGQIIQSHALHFFFLAAPDYLGIDNALKIAKEKPQVFKIALALKEVGDDIIRTIGGRQIHPVTPTVGGFTTSFSKKTLNDLKNRVSQKLSFATEAVDLAFKFEYPNFPRKTEYFALTDGPYAYIKGDLSSSGSNENGHASKVKSNIQNYQLNIKEKVVSHSTAKHAIHDGHPYMVGALARINLQPRKLNPKVKNIVDHHGFKLPSYNPYHMNLAQAIEILHFMEEVVKNLESLASKKELKVKVPYKVVASEAAGAIEAPRGTLYHYYKIDKEGLIQDCDIITPTVQNLANAEADAEYILGQTANLSEAERYKLLEMLVRAYDPCITCSVH